MRGERCKGGSNCSDLQPDHSGLLMLHQLNLHSYSNFTVAIRPNSYVRITGLAELFRIRDNYCSSKSATACAQANKRPHRVPYPEDAGGRGLAAAAGLRCGLCRRVLLLTASLQPLRRRIRRHSVQSAVWIPPQPLRPEHPHQP